LAIYYYIYKKKFFVGLEENYAVDWDCVLSAAISSAICESELSLLTADISSDHLRWPKNLIEKKAFKG